MRAGLTIMSAAMLLVLTVHVEGQTALQQQASTFFTGVNPQDVKVVPVDVSKAMQTLNINQSFATPRPPTPFVLSNYFPTISFASWPPKIAKAPMLTKGPFSTVTIVPPPPPKKKK